MVGARSFPGSLCDGHVFNAQLEQTRVLLEDTGKVLREAIVDLGYRGWTRTTLGWGYSARASTARSRRFSGAGSGAVRAVEPAIGHLKKAEHRMNRCWLRGALGDACHALLCAAGYNLPWLMRAMVPLGLRTDFLRPLFPLLLVLPAAITGGVRSGAARGLMVAPRYAAAG